MIHTVTDEELERARQKVVNWLWPEHPELTLKAVNDIAMLVARERQPPTVRPACVPLVRLRGSSTAINDAAKMGTDEFEFSFDRGITWSRLYENGP